MRTEKEQLVECNEWAELLKAAGYTVTVQWEDASDAFSYLFVVNRSRGKCVQVATFDIDGCGASWHGPDDLWLEVIGKHVGVFA